MYNKESYLRVIIGLAILIFVIQIIITGLNSFTLSTVLRKASTAISISLIFHYIFKKWLWKLKICRPFIVKVPNLHGTWTGRLESYWENSQNNKISPIEIKAFVRQNFDSISIEMHTEKMISTSYIANIITDKNTGIQELCYVYTSKSKIETRETNPWHDGTTKLLIYDEKNPRLEGEYWTSRKTIGKIILKRNSKKI